MQTGQSVNFYDNADPKFPTDKDGPFLAIVKFVNADGTVNLNVRLDEETFIDKDGKVHLTYPNGVFTRTVPVIAEGDTPPVPGNRYCVE